MSYLLRLTTIQAGPFRILIDALKDIIPETNIEFTDKGMKIKTTNPSKTILIHLKLEGSKFQHYKCNKAKLVIGVNMVQFNQLLKTMTNSDNLTLQIDSANKNELEIRIDNKEKGYLNRYKLKLMDITDTSIHIPPVEISKIITMRSTEFQRICRNMNNIGEEIIEIKSVGKQIILGCKGDYATQETILSESKNGLKFIDNKEPDKVYHGSFILKDLLLFTKCTGLAPEIKIYLENEYPLIIDYVVGNMGILQYGLSPKDDVDEIEEDLAKSKV